jgi:hypothetical protein
VPDFQVRDLFWSLLGMMPRARYFLPLLLQLRAIFLGHEVYLQNVQNDQVTDMHQLLHDNVSALRELKSNGRQ